MITDAVITFLSTILTKIVGLLPASTVVATGNGAASGTLCCATLMIVSITALIDAAPIPIRDTHGNTGIAALVNATPFPLLIDFYWFGFVVGCLLAIAAAFFIVRILLLFWQQVKW